MSENKENKKNKNLNEKEIEKVSGVQKIDPKFYENRLFDPKIFDKNHPQFMICKYGGPGMLRPKKYGGPPIIKPKEKNSNPNEIKNLQPFSDEDKDKN